MPLLWKWLERFTLKLWRLIKIELLVANTEYIRNRRCKVRAAGVLLIALRGINEEWMESGMETGKVSANLSPRFGRWIDGARAPSPNSLGCRVILPNRQK